MDPRTCAGPSQGGTATSNADYFDALEHHTRSCYTAYTAQPHTTVSYGHATNQYDAQYRLVLPVHGDRAVGLSVPMRNAGQKQTRTKQAESKE